MKYFKSLFLKQKQYTKLPELGTSEFLEIFYPNYASSDEILRLDDLARVDDGELDVYEFNTIYNTDYTSVEIISEFHNTLRIAEMKAMNNLLDMVSNKEIDIIEVDDN